MLCLLTWFNTGLAPACVELEDFNCGKDSPTVNVEILPHTLSLATGTVLVVLSQIARGLKVDQGLIRTKNVKCIVNMKSL